jgi:hypothetical protein
VADDKDPEEVKLEQIARRVLSMPPKRQSEMKVAKRGKPARKPKAAKGKA